ncbi:MAG: UMF1 family MFS transporter [Planctomycetota bacterium]|jgi:UMF1 family MFS transporter
MDTTPEPQPNGFLVKIGLDSPEKRGWVMYDWANSAFFTVVVTAVFPIYFASVAASGIEPDRATGLFAAASAVALLLVALVAPPLGTLADARGRRKKYLAGFALLGILSTAALFFVGEGDWKLGLVFFALANLGAGASTVFYDSLLNHIAGPKEVDAVSTAGFALGYVGGGVMLGLSLIWIANPGLVGLTEGTLGPRLAFLAVSLWWLVFSLPLIRRVPEPPAAGKPGTFVSSFLGLAGTLRELRTYPQAFLLLLAFFVYNDGILTIIRMAALYGKTINLDSNQLILAVLMVQFVGIPCSFAFGGLARRIGPKSAILIGLGVYVIVALLGYFMKTATHFYILAGLVALVQGGTQALSRSLFSTMIPRHKSAEFFGFYAVGEKFAGVLGPTLFATVLFAGGTSRSAMLWLVLFFLVGGFLLTKVDVEAGRKQAKSAEFES